MKRQEQVKKLDNPDIDVLFEQVEQPIPEENFVSLTADELNDMIDPRNSEANIGFIDVMGFRCRHANAHKLPVNMNTW